MRAAVYARFSSDNQREQSIEDQIRVCRDYAKRNDVNILENHVYFDEAKSGALRDRPGLESMKKAAEARQFDVILIDDSSRLSRDNQYFNTLLCLFQYWGVGLISVSDGLNSKEEHAKVAYQFRGIFNELYLSDLRKKTHRGQMGQIVRGYTIGYLGYGYRSVPVGETKYDKKGRLRAVGFQPQIVPEEAAIISRIFKDFTEGNAINRIARELNTEKISTHKSMKGGWNVSTISRILKNEKYTGKFIWNTCTTVKDPLSGKRKKVERPKEEWVIQEKPEMRIITDETWNIAERRWKEIESAFPTGKKKPGFSVQQKGRVKINPTHLLSGSLRCGCCEGSIALVSGKGSGYYGCLNASRKSCDNKVLVSRALLEKHFIKVLFEDVLKPERFQQVFDQVAKAIKEQFSDVPEEIRQKKIALNAVESRVHNFIEFVAQGRATKGLVDALEEAEKKVDSLKKDLESLQRAKENLFQPPPEAWISKRISEVKSVLEKKTEQSALLLRSYLGTVTLMPTVPDIGKPYYQAHSKIKTFALLENSDLGSNSLQWWRWGESNPRPRNLNVNFLHV